jgi:hypothetical protein
MLAAVFILFFSDAPYAMYRGGDGEDEDATEILSLFDDDCVVPNPVTVPTDDNGFFSITRLDI